MTARLYTAILLVGLALAFTTGYSLSSWQARRDTGWQALPAASPPRDLAETKAPPPAAPAEVPIAPIPAGQAPAAAPAADAIVAKPAHAAKKTPHLLSPNQASAADLQCLPGVGPVIAARIVEYRKANGAFGSAEDLRHVKGIGPKILEKLRPYLRFP